MSATRSFGIDARDDDEGWIPWIHSSVLGNSERGNFRTTQRIFQCRVCVRNLVRRALWQRLRKWVRKKQQQILTNLILVGHHFWAAYAPTFRNYMRTYGPNLLVRRHPLVSRSGPAVAARLRHCWAYRIFFGRYSWRPMDPYVVISCWLPKIQMQNWTLIGSNLVEHSWCHQWDGGVSFWNGKPQHQVSLDQWVNLSIPIGGEFPFQVSILFGS